MARVETVLLDAGGVLLDLDYGYLRRLIERRHVRVDEDSLSRFEAVARNEMHREYEKGRSVRDSWRDYFRIILGRAGVGPDAQPEIVDSLWEAHQRVGLWTVAVEGGPEAVSALRRDGYRVGVVSNAEGSVARDLDSAGYAGLFETVVDSHLVGVEKPDPQIFSIALERMGATAGSAVFLGDLPAVDVVGARAAGIAPLLLDRHDLYPDADVPRLGSIRELPGHLASLAERSAGG